MSQNPSNDEKVINSPQEPVTVENSKPEKSGMATKPFVVMVAIASILVNASITLMATSQKESNMVEFVSERISNKQQVKVLDYEYMTSMLESALTKEEMVDYLDIYLQLAAKKNIVVVDSSLVANMDADNMLTAVKYSALLQEARKYGITPRTSEMIELKTRD